MPTDTIVIPAAVVEQLRRKAKKLAKLMGIPHHEALDRVARDGIELPDWHHLIEQAKATEPSEQAFKRGLIVGMDRKDVEDVHSSELTRLVIDHRVVMFLRAEYERWYPRPWSEDTQYDWENIEELVFFRQQEIVPRTLEEALKLCHENFFFPPRYVRLRGKVVMNLFSEEDDNV